MKYIDFASRQYSTVYLLTPCPQPLHFASEGINYYYVLHKSGKGLFAYPKGRPRKGADRAKGGIPIPSSDDIETRILKIRRDKIIPDSSEWMVLLSFATDDMIRYMSMYPHVWFMDCTAGMYDLYMYKSYVSINTNMIRTLPYPYYI